MSGAQLQEITLKYTEGSWMSWTASQVLKLGPPKYRTEVLTALWQRAVGYLVFR
jgi:hypothetical protein